MYGVTHVAAVDGWSGMIVGFVTMPIKNNLVIYSNLYRQANYAHVLLCYFATCHRPIVLSYGLWDKIRVDQGKEWILTLYVQETLEH